MMRTRTTPSPTIRTASHLAPGADRTAPARPASDGRRAERPAAATAVSVALNIGHAPNHLAARLFAALPPIALLGAVELLMSVARCGLHLVAPPLLSPPAKSGAAARKTADPTINASAPNDALP